MKGGTDINEKGEKGRTKEVNQKQAKGMKKEK